MASIFLVGFMGCGKTTVGEILAERLGWKFVDLDERITERENRSIPEIFADSGEAAFRLAERKALEAIVAAEETVVATGGGLFHAPENRMTIAAAGGWSVFLDVPWAVLEVRIDSGDHRRPLWRSSVQAHELYESRLPAYRMADAVVKVEEDQTAAAIAEQIILMKPEFRCAI